MATVTELNNPPLSGLKYIDALIDTGPAWNYLTPVGNTLYYTFSVTTGNESGQTGQAVFSASQQAWTRAALDYVSQVTGVQFAQTSDGTAAQLHFANIDIRDSSQTTGLCSWQGSYGYSTSNPDQLVSYTANAFVYLDNNEWYAQNSDLSKGGYGYETLLHELGHAMGLKHPFEGDITLSASQDNTANTLMSYSYVGGPYSSFSQYDVAALNWIYGGDGLRGALGTNSTTGARYITGSNADDVLTGTQYDDTLEGDGGNDQIDGGAGSDTVVFRSPRSDYTITQLASGALVVAGPSTLDGTDTLTNVEILKFSDGVFQRAQVGADTTPPVAPSVSVTKNANGYALGATPVVTGSAEAGSTVKLYSGSDVVGTTVVDSTGLWSITTTAFKDGLGYSIYATATDAAGNTSAKSSSITFNIDAHAPVIPTGDISLTAGTNNPLFSGSGEVGTLIQLVNINNATEIARTTVSGSGLWNIPPTLLPNGAYSVSVVSLDAADNATTSAKRIDFTIDSKSNFTGDAKANTFTSTVNNNAVDGGGGLDTMLYGSARTNFTVSKQVLGYLVVDKTGDQGRDLLVNVERVQFSDGKAVALDIDGNAGQVYRLYQAAFDRTPDAGGYAYWLNAMDHGYTLNQISSFVLQNKEAVDLYMSNPTDDYFVTQLYQHVLHRNPDAAGLAFWLGNIHAASRAEVLGMFSESPENQAQVIGTIQNGIDYTPWSGS
jgi:serralysin